MIASQTAQVPRAHGGGVRGARRGATLFTVEGNDDEEMSVEGRGRRRKGKGGRSAERGGSGERRRRGLGERGPKVWIYQMEVGARRGSERREKNNKKSSRDGVSKHLSCYNSSLIRGCLYTAWLVKRGEQGLSCLAPSLSLGLPTLPAVFTSLPSLLSPAALLLTTQLKRNHVVAFNSQPIHTRSSCQVPSRSFRARPGRGCAARTVGGGGAVPFHFTH